MQLKCKCTCGRKQNSTKKYRNNLSVTVGVVLLGVMLVFAAAVPILSPHGTTGIHAEIRNLGGSFLHPFGTDRFGRDLFTRVWYGAGISLLIGGACAVICTMVGVIYGAASAMSRPGFDLILMRAVDVLDAVPSLLYIILIMLVLGNGIGSMILGICIAGWTKMARITRSEVMRFKESDFVLAVRLSGAGSFHILWKHLLANIKGPIGVQAMFLVPEAIFSEAFLSFVGVGLQAPTASLGTLIQEGKRWMLIYPGQMLWPMLILCGIILAMNLIGSGLEGLRYKQEGSREV